MSLFIGKGDSGSNMLHLTKSTHELPELKSGEVFDDTILSPGLSFLESKFATISNQVSYSINTSCPGESANSAFVFGPYSFGSTEFPFIIEAEDLDTAMVTIDYAGAIKTFTGAAFVRSCQPTVFYIADDLFSTIAVPKTLTITTFNTAKEILGGEVIVDKATLSIGSEDVLKLRTTLIQTSPGGDMADMLAENPVGVSQEIQMLVKAPTGDGVNTNVPIHVASNMSYSDSLIIEPTGIDMTRDSLKTFDGSSVIFNSAREYVTSKDVTSTLVYRGNFPPTYSNPYRGWINTVGVLDGVTSDTKAVVFHKLVFYKYPFTPVETFYNVFVPILDNSKYVVVHNNMYKNMYNSTLVSMLVNSTTGVFSYCTHEDYMFDAYSWGSTTSGVDVINYTVIR